MRRTADSRREPSRTCAILLDPRLVRELGRPKSRPPSTGRSTYYGPHGPRHQHSLCHFHCHCQCYYYYHYMVSRGRGRPWLSDSSRLVYEQLFRSWSTDRGGLRAIGILSPSGELERSRCLHSAWHIIAPRSGSPGDWWLGTAWTACKHLFKDSPILHVELNLPLVTQCVEQRPSLSSGKALRPNSASKDAQSSSLFNSLFSSLQLFSTK